MKNLNFSQAFALTKEGYALRREEWRKWMTRHHALSWIWTPATAVAAAEEHIVLHTEIARTDMLAWDWTDEPWDDGDGMHGDHWPPYVKPPDPKRKRPPTGGGHGGGGNPPGPGGDPGPDPGPGGGDVPPPGGSGGGGGPDPGPDARPAGAPTITVVVTSITEMLGCYDVPIMTTPDTVELAVEITIAGGSPGVGTLSAVLAGVTQGGMTGWPGMNKTITFADVAFVLGGTLTATVTYSIGGTPYTGSGDFTFPDACPITSSGSGGGGGMI